MTDDAFDNADFYDCSDPEQLNASTVAEALEALFEQNCYAAGESREVIAARVTKGGAIQVTAYVKGEPPSDSQRDRMAERFIDDLCEWWADEWGNPDGDASAVPGCALAFREAIDLWIAGQTVWACREVGTRSYTAEEAIAILSETAT